MVCTCWPQSAEWRGLSQEGEEIPWHRAIISPRHYQPLSYELLSLSLSLCRCCTRSSARLTSNGFDWDDIRKGGWRFSDAVFLLKREATKTDQMWKNIVPCLRVCCDLKRLSRGSRAAPVARLQQHTCTWLSDPWPPMHSCPRPSGSRGERSTCYMSAQRPQMTRCTPNFYGYRDAHSELRYEPQVTFKKNNNKKNYVMVRLVN